ncbi:hypothetical protein ACFQ3B_13740 [Stackebrandtia endophytica]|uniref:hypothetical protein n=1 Tax=Stackebrandtia endophytica TaxID=1496996 RepID=UPI001150EF63|nr:hypothetical protein [Stackebrandtia endophytica]
MTEYAGHQAYYSSLCETTERLRDELDSKLETLCDSAGESSTTLFQNLLNLRNELVSLRDSASSNRDSISDIVTILTRLREDADRLHAEDADWRANVDEDDAATLRSIRESVRAELQSKVLEADAVLWHRALTMSSPPPSAPTTLDAQPHPMPTVESPPAAAGESTGPEDGHSTPSTPRRVGDRTTDTDPTAASPTAEKISDIVNIDGMDVEVTIEMDGEMLRLSDIEAEVRAWRQARYGHR